MNINDKTYIVGHIRPDLDSIACAIGYQEYMKYKGNFDYCAIRSGEVNNLTKWVFSEFNTKLPEIIPNISGMDIVLVDHSDIKQRPKGWDKANIKELIDHHEPEIDDLSLENNIIKECGASSTIVADMIINEDLNIDRNLAGILLCAILDDTLGLESPTTTSLDTDTVYILANICNIQDIEELSSQLISKKDIWNELTNREIIEMDMKEDNINGNTLSISQVETMNNAQLHSEGILTELKKINDENPLNLRIVMLTDLSNKRCILLVVGKDIDIFEKAINKQIINNTVVLPNVVSRKKQILPILENMYI